MPETPDLPAPLGLLRAELVRVLLGQGSHFRGNALLALSMPEILASAESVEQLVRLRDGLRTLTQLASGSIADGPLAPDELVRRAVAIAEAAAPYESVTIGLDAAPGPGAVGGDGDRSLLLVLVLVTDARRRIRDTGRAGSIRMTVAEVPGGVAVDAALDREVGPTRYAELYRLARAAARAEIEPWAGLHGGGADTLPTLRLGTAPG